MKTLIKILLVSLISVFCYAYACFQCQGTGIIIERCLQCNGTGGQWISRDLFQTCIFCKGLGIDRKRCMFCNGTGEIGRRY
jgi:hypothetical protein